MQKAVRLRRAEPARGQRPQWRALLHRRLGGRRHPGARHEAAARRHQLRRRHRSWRRFRLRQNWIRCRRHSPRRAARFPRGSCPTVGVAGLTLGGGLGSDARLAGLTCDALVSASVVLPSGETVTASADDHADLFWALRGGGGGNFGVVTSLTFRTFPVTDRDVVTLAFPLGSAAAVIARLARAGSALPTGPSGAWSTSRWVAGPDGAPSSWRHRPATGPAQGRRPRRRDRGAAVVDPHPHTEPHRLRALLRGGRRTQRSRGRSSRVRTSSVR